MLSWSCYLGCYPGAVTLDVILELISWSYPGLSRSWYPGLSWSWYPGAILDVI